MKSAWRRWRKGCDFLCIIIVATWITVLGVAANAAATSIGGNYTVTVDYGDGVSQDLGTYSFSTGPGDPLAYDQTRNVNDGSASAAFGIWGFADESGWGFWLTDGTGVGQNDPNHLIGKTNLVMNMDMYVYDDVTGDGQGLYAGWYEMVNLQGTVGGEGSYVGFTGHEEMWTGTSIDNESYYNELDWDYFNEAPGQFYVTSGQILPNPFDEYDYLEDGEYMHLTGVYTFFANNDGGPSAINFSENSPGAVPIPAPILLLGTGLFGIAGFRKRLKM